MVHDKYTKLAVWEYSRRVDLGKILKEVCQNVTLKEKTHWFSEFFACILLLCYVIYLIACVQGETHKA